MKIKGQFFATEPDGEEIRIYWSDKTPDRSKWDPLDFWNVAPKAVERTIERLREGVEL